MNTITDDQIAEIEALAGRATPGPWTLTLDRDLSVASSEWGLFDIRQDQPNFVVDAHYAAAANPASILALITRLREAERDAARYRWLRERLVGASFDWDDEGMVVLAFEMPDGVSIGADCDKNIDTAMKGEQQ